MSLFFERALGEFSPAELRHLRTSEDALGDADAPSVPLGDLVRLVSNRAGALEHPDREDWLCVPLHERESAELTGEYVVYEDHPVRGDIFVYLDADAGDLETVRCDEADSTALARRLRFWHPTFTPDRRPSYARDGPTTRVSPSHPVGDADAYFDRLRGFLDDERDAQRERNRERTRHHSPEELRAAGESAIPELSGFTPTGEGAYQSRAVVDDTHGDLQDRFGVFEGDEVLVHAPASTDPPEEFPVPATVERIAGFSLDLVLHDPVDDLDAVERSLVDAEGAGLSSLLNPVTYDRERAAIDAVAADSDRRAIVDGGRDAAFTGGTGRETSQRDRRLNDEQAFAAACALYADDVCCIHGPPGTGKTRVLIEIVRRAVADGERVLVCADSNQGVDNILVGATVDEAVDEQSLHRYAAVEDEFTLDRYHAHHSDHEFVRDRYADGPGRPDVVAATNNSAADFDDGEFDLAVVDEATQATARSTFIPFTKADGLVLAGDHKQLPPFSATDPPADDDDRYLSLFEHFYADDGVYGRPIGVRLTTQYRMHEKVAGFPNRAFYGGTLENGRDVEPIDGLPPLVGVDVSGDERVDDAHSYYNDEEATEVRSLVERLLGAGVTPGEIGVITPYQAQVDAVERSLRKLSEPDADEVEVDTIDSFQGSEREAIVISFVRSNDRGDIGFLGRSEDGPRRLNVALTRAERFCGLVADWDTLRTPGDGENDAAGLYRDLYDRLADRGKFGDGSMTASGEK